MHGTANATLATVPDGAIIIIGSKCEALLAACSPSSQGRTTYIPPTPQEGTCIPWVGGGTLSLPSAFRTHSLRSDPGIAMAPSHSLLGLNGVCVAVLLVLISVAAGSHSAHAQAVHGGEPTRKVIEHVYLWQAKADLDEAAEDEFLYSMWNLQNTVTNVEFLSWTVGKIINETPQNVRYAMLGRFPSVDHLNKYMGNQVVWAWAGQHLSPVAGQEFGIDFEAEVPDTFESLHKIGEGFESAVKYVLLLTAQGGSSPAAALHSLISSSPSSVVDVTAGPAVVASSAGLSHGVVADLKSVESVEEFRAQPAFQELLSLSSQFVEGIFYPFQAPALERVLGASKNLRHKSSLHISTI